MPNRNKTNIFKLLLYYQGISNCVQPCIHSRCECVYKFKAVQALLTFFHILCDPHGQTCLHEGFSVPGAGDCTSTVISIPSLT